MLIKRLLNLIGILPFLSPTLSLSASVVDPSLGQHVQIYSQLHSFVGKPSWLLIIRDLDNGRNIPYLFDFTQPTQFWIAFTFSRNYLIKASNLQFSPYRYNPCVTYFPYCSKRISNFCNLETGHIMHGESLYIILKGHLSPNPNTYTCHVSQYYDTSFTIVKTPETRITITHESVITY